LKNIIISPEVLHYINHEKGIKDPNLAIYRDIARSGCCSVRTIEFIPKVKIMDEKKPNEYFIMVDNSYGIPVWIEKGLLTQLENKPILITLKKGLLGGLKIEFGPEILKRQ
jgi:hypothetical protein